MDSATLLNQDMQDGENVLLVGPPGCAKTARIDATTAANQRRLVTQRTSLSERVDFGGCLVPDYEAGITRALPLAVMHDLQTTEIPTVFFVDDLGQAPMDVQAALMRCFDPGFLSPHVLVWGATNRVADRAGVTGLCEPLRSRFTQTYVIPTPDTEDDPTGGVLINTWQEELAGWISWALDAGAPATVIAFHRSTGGRHLYDWKPSPDPSIRMPDYRTWATVIRRLNKGREDLHTLSAAIGKPTAATFLAYAALVGKVPTPDQVWMDPANAPVPEDPGALYLIASSLAIAATEKHARPLMTYVDRLPRVYGALCARDALQRLGDKLAGQAAWVKWFTKNQALFTSN